MITEQSLNDYAVGLEGGITLIYGPSGGGKTVMSSTYPAPLRYIDYDDGWKSILWAIKKGICPHKADQFKRVVPKDDFDAKGKLIKATGYEQTLEAINYWIDDERIDSWRTMVIDPMTTLNRFSMHAGMQISGTLMKVGGSPVKSESYAVSQTYGIMVWGVQDYRPAQSLLDQILTFNKYSLREIAKAYKKHIILICHEYEKYKAPEQIGGLPTLMGVEPDLMGRHRTDIVKDCDEVYHIRNDGTAQAAKFQVRTIGNAMYVAKSRYGCLDQYEPADFRTLDGKIRAFYGSAEPKTAAGSGTRKVAAT